MKKVLFIFFILLSRESFAGRLYGSLMWEWTAVTSQRDLTNGASDSTIGFDMGYRFTDLSLEVLYRNFTLTEVFTEERGDFDVSIEDKYFGFGIRYNHQPWIHSKLGWAFHLIDGSFPRRQGGELRSHVDGNFGGFYLGFGLKWWGNEFIDVYSDLTFNKASSEISHIGFSFGIRGYFFEL